MFAVPGWKLSPATLKTQVEDVKKSSSRKRKRKAQEEEEVARLIDGKIEAPSGVPTQVVRSGDAAKPISDAQLSQRNTPTIGNRAEIQGDPKNAAKKKKAGNETTLGSESSKPQASLKSKDVKQKKVRQEGTGNKTDRQTRDPDGVGQHRMEDSALTMDAAHAGSGLTPMQSAMRQKLVSARFRHLNEKLYTSPSAHAAKLFDENPTFFQEYHSGFRQQVASWPENPVDVFAKELLSRGQVYQRKHRPNESHAQKPVVLPRTGGKCTVADLGCGDAALSQVVEKKGKKLNVEVLSFDLQAPSKRITKADIANLPLDSGSVNIAIFCLALMGNNWIDFIEEAYRILHWKGELWVAEIKSRFGKAKHARVQHSVGHRTRTQLPKDSRRKELGKDNETGQAELLATEIDGAEARDETDVSGFVQVLKDRGFALYDENAVDRSNKMFVRLRFTKSLPAAKGKNVTEEGEGLNGKRRKPQFVDDVTDFDEASILKPCLYKIR